MPILKLKHPLKLGQSNLTELKFREHTIAQDYLAFDKRGAQAQRIALVASICGTDEALIEKLHGIDYRAAATMMDKILEADEAFDKDDKNEKEANDPAKKSPESSLPSA